MPSGASFKGPVVHEWAQRESRTAGPRSRDPPYNRCKGSALPPVPGLPKPARIRVPAIATRPARQPSAPSPRGRPHRELQAYLPSVPAAGVAGRVPPPPTRALGLPERRVPPSKPTEPTFFRRGAFKLAGPLLRASHWPPPSSLIGCFLSNKDSPRCACAQ